MKKYIIIGIIILIIVALLSLTWLSFFKSAGKAVSLEIKEGDSTMSVGNVLKQKKVIFSSKAFYLYVHLKNLTLQPGYYDFTSKMNMIQMINKISSGESSEIAVTIPEGYRLTQIDALLVEKKLITAGDLIKIASADEGYLFPDTYHFKKVTTAQEIREIMTNNFDKQVEKVSNQKISREALTIASIVEREAKFDEDRAKIAGVYFSRLDIKMKLQADPTIQYGKGSWAPITVSDYTNFSSPYNTYLHEGLPPTPICNPGIKSIKAAFKPVKDGSLYFFTDSNNHAVFSKTLLEHETKVRNQQK